MERVIHPAFYLLFEKRIQKMSTYTVRYTSHTCTVCGFHLQLTTLRSHYPDIGFMLRMSRDKFCL